MNILACDGTLTIDASGAPACAGSWSVTSPTELVTLTNGLTGADFQYIAGTVTVWFLLAFGVKVIRRTFNI